MLLQKESEIKYNITMMQKYVPYLLALLIPFSVQGVELSRLDDFGIESVNKSDYLVHLFITQNCSVCSKQVDTLQKCLAPNKVAAYIEGVNEEKLRTYIKRKKLKFKTFHLNPGLKNDLGFGTESPAMSFYSEGKLKTVIGFKSCDEINSIIKAGNSDQRK